MDPNQPNEQNYNTNPQPSGMPSEPQLPTPQTMPESQPPAGPGSSDYPMPAPVEPPISQPMPPQPQVTQAEQSPQPYDPNPLHDNPAVPPQPSPVPYATGQTPTPAVDPNAGQPMTPSVKPKPSRRTLLIVLIVIIVVVAAGILAWVFLRHGSNSSTSNSPNNVITGTAVKPR